MKTNSTQQEVLLVTGTSFATGQLCKNDNSSNNNQLNDIEQMAEACWNGLLPELLPEIFNKTLVDKKTYLWQIREGNSFLELEFADFPEQKDDFFSIDPYNFLATEFYN